MIKMKIAKIKKAETIGLKFSIEGKTIFLELPKTMTVKQLAEIIMNKKRR